MEFTSAYIHSILAQAYVGATLINLKDLPNCKTKRHQYLLWLESDPYPASFNFEKSLFVPLTYLFLAIFYCRRCRWVIFYPVVRAKSAQEDGLLDFPTFQPFRLRFWDLVRAVSLQLHLTRRFPFCCFYMLWLGLDGTRRVKLAFRRILAWGVEQGLCTHWQSCEYLEASQT